MRRKILKALFISFSILLMIVYSINYAKNEKIREFKELYKQQIGLELPEGCEVVEQKDTYDGFKGEGEELEVIKFNDEQFEEVIKEAESNDEWHEFPISEEVNYLIYRIKTKNIARYLNIGFERRMNVGRETNETITEEPFKEKPYYDQHEHQANGLASEIPYGIKEGMFYLKNKDSSKVDEEGAIIIQSYKNFNIAIIDAELKIMYIYKLKT